MSWSSRERVSRTEPPPARTTSGSTPGSTSMASAVAQLLHVVEHLRGRHEPERVVVRAGADRADDLLGLGRREDELDVLRRLFDDLQQRVETLRGDHVRLVEDEDLVAVAGGREDRALAQVARVVDAVVAAASISTTSSEPPPSRLSSTQRGAHPARRVRRALGAVEAAGEDARGRRLAASARPAEQVGVVDAVGAQRGAQRIGHLGLADELGERLRPVTAVQGSDHASSVAAPCDTCGRLCAPHRVALSCTDRARHAECGGRHAVGRVESVQRRAGAERGDDLARGTASAPPQLPMPGEAHPVAAFATRAGIRRITLDRWMGSAPSATSRRPTSFSRRG